MSAAPVSETRLDAVSEALGPNAARVLRTLMAEASSTGYVALPLLRVARLAALRESEAEHALRDLIQVGYVLKARNVSGHGRAWRLGPTFAPPVPAWQPSLFEPAHE